MKDIKIRAHYPKDEASDQFIAKATTETYVKAVTKLLNQSDLPIIEKKELLTNLIKKEHGTSVLSH